jgi:hypothetical protein
MNTGISWKVIAKSTTFTNGLIIYMNNIDDVDNVM